MNGKAVSLWFVKSEETVHHKHKRPEIHNKDKEKKRKKRKEKGAGHAASCSAPPMDLPRLLATKQR